MASSASGPEKKCPFKPSSVPLDCEEGAMPDTITSWLIGSRRASAVNRTSGFTSTTLGSAAISFRAASSSGRGGARSAASRGLRRPPPGWPKGALCRDRTEIVSNNPARATERSTSCCNPTPSESSATSEATPTEMPSVVSELRSTASRKFRAASSVRSPSFIASAPRGKWLRRIA